MSSLASMAASCATPHPRHTAAVIGGSLGGLAAAHALQQTGWQVDVYERSNGPLHDKGAGLGFVHVPAWESLTGERRRRPMMRRGRRAHRGQGSFYYGDLWKYLYQGLWRDDSETSLPEPTIHFGKTVTELQVPTGNKCDNNNHTVGVDGQTYDLVVVCDGGFSSLRKYVVDDAEPEYAGYVVWRGSVEMNDLPRDFEIEEGVYKHGIYDTIVLKMAKDNGDDLWTMGTFIATPQDEIHQYWNKDRNGKSRHVEEDADDDGNRRNDKVPDWFLSHFQKHFANVPGLVPLIQAMLEKGQITPHPQFEFGDVARVHRGRIVLLGDAAHMASPRTAVGAHTAILDALALRQALNARPDSVEGALALYSSSGVERARELYHRTRQISQQFVAS